MNDIKSDCIGGALNRAVNPLGDESEVARIDAEVLLAHALNQSRSYLHTWPRRRLKPDELARFTIMLKRRKGGEPVAYIVGQREFWSMSLKVNRHTLIPRPETECLVASAIHHIPPYKPLLVVDLGTGSGAIALAIARERPACQVVATDCSAHALRLAQENAHRLSIANVSFRLGDWIEPVQDEQYDVVLSNPPYVVEDDPCLDQGDLRHEPPMALRSGADGLQAIRHIADVSCKVLNRGGWLLIEHGYQQGADVQALFGHYGYKKIYSILDLAGHPRVVAGQYG